MHFAKYKTMQNHKYNNGIIKTTPANGEFFVNLLHAKDTKCEHPLDLNK